MTSRHSPPSSASSSLACRVQTRSIANFSACQNFSENAVSRPGSRAPHARHSRSTASPAVTRAKAARPLCPPGRARKSPCASSRARIRARSSTRRESFFSRIARPLAALKSIPATVPSLISFHPPARRQKPRCARVEASAFGHEPVLMREGGSIPIVNHFKSTSRRRNPAPRPAVCPTTTPIHLTKNSTSVASTKDN